MARTTWGLLLALTVSATLAGCVGSGSSSQMQNNTPSITAIAITPQSSAVTVAKTLQFSAKATYSDGSTKDVSSTALWATSDPTVATISTAGVATGMKIGVVTIGVSSGTVRSSVLLNVTTKAFNLGSLNGPYTFSLTAETNQPRWETGSIKADGAGNITGIEDINASTGVAQSVTITGKYTVLADGRGTLTLTTAGEPSRTFHFVLSGNSASHADNNAQLIQFDKAGTAVGLLLRQDATALNNASLASHVFVFRLGGLDSTQNPISRIGEFSVGGSGTTVSSGEQDENDNGTINSGAGPTTAVGINAGSIGAIDPNTGRSTLSLTAGGRTSNFAAYVVAANQIELIGLDTAPMLAGQAEIQPSPVPAAAAAGGYVLVTEIGGTMGQYWIMGQLQVSSTGSVTALTQNQDGGMVLNFVTPAGSLNVSAGGRGTLQENTNHGARTFTIYLVSSSKLYVVQSNDPHAGSGTAEQQQPGPDGFSTGTLNDSFVLSAADTSDGNLGMVGEVVADGAGHLIGLVDLSQPQPGNPSQLALSTVALVAGYSQPTTGGVATGVVTTQGAGIQNLVLYLDSSSKALILGISPTDANGTIVLQ